MNLKIKLSIAKKTMLVILFSMLVQLLMPLKSFALTSGPAQPEFQSFEPATTSQMVDLFSGDFTYNIPLFELPGPNGGYPFNLAYQSGVSMEQEASWVGLGWVLNTGAINRNLRGLPDDFRGDGETPDKLITKQDMKDNWTATIGGGVGFKLAGTDFLKQTTGSFGIGVSYNSYRGVGLSTNTSFGITSKDNGIGAGLGLNLDSYDGVGVNPSVSLSSVSDNGKSTLSIGVGYNSIRGLEDLNFTVSHTSDKAYSKKTKKIASVRESSVSGTSSYSFSASSFSPSIDNVYNNYNIRVGIVFGVKTTYFGEPTISMHGSHTVQRLAHKNKSVTSYPYGYLYYDKCKDFNSKDFVLDFNREKEGVVRENTNNLAIPNYTYDIYSVLGQGTGGTFRAHRNDAGYVTDKYTYSGGGGTAATIDLGVGSNGTGTSSHGGFGVSFNGNDNLITQFPTANNIMTFKGKSDVSSIDYETYYFKYAGDINTEATTAHDYLHKDKIVTYNLEDHKTASLNISGYPTTGHKSNRTPRSNSIQQYTNLDINALNNQGLPEFNNVAFYTETDNFTQAPNHIFSRTETTKYKKHHIGGFTVLNPDGNRYNYGIPVYNMKHKENIYSTPNRTQAMNQNDPVTIAYEPSVFGEDETVFHQNAGDNYLNSTSYTPYASTYLITSVLGNDYVDLTNNGPTDDDLGYWVKFNYVKRTENYIWKAPFTGAAYTAGIHTNPDDDKANFSIGEREVYYLASAETKTHIAVFNLDYNRTDGLGIKSYSALHINGIVKAGSSAKLKDIKLYIKEDYYKGGAMALTTAHFIYRGEASASSASSLCNGIDNSSNNGGKLTLDKVYFTHERSSKGATTPYIFQYNETYTMGGNTKDFDYNRLYQDRWGNYKDYSLITADENWKYQFPYTQQFFQNSTAADNDKAAFKNYIDDISSAWLLTEIKTPSGANLKINYEADDYAFVQHKTAGQMFQITGTGYSRDKGFNADDKLFGDGFEPNNEEHRKLYFKLENPILASDPNKNKLLSRYFEDLKNPDGIYQVYFKSLMNLKRYEDSQKEIISGYMTFQPNKWGFADPVDIGGTNYYKEAYIIVDKPRIGQKEFNYHPMSFAAWQFYKATIYGTACENDLPTTEVVNTNAERLNIFKSLINMTTRIQDFISGYYTNREAKRWSNKIDLDASFIRLNTPDKIKYGGGHRVKNITIQSNWKEDDSHTKTDEYGISYDYTTNYTNELTNETYKISSGVATYEPILGGEEISLRYAKYVVQTIPLHTPENYMFEYPYNEALFPGASVGYSKVTVSSLATDKQIKNLIPNDVPTTGKTVNEFYTAYDFPVLVEASTIQKVEKNDWYPVPFIGMYDSKKLGATQGYKIELNDMHGKPKRTGIFGMTADGKFSTDELSSVEYRYKEKSNVVYEGKKIHKLDNTVNALTHDAISAQHEMGVEYDLFTDSRSSSTHAGSGGVDINFDQEQIFTIAITAPIPWPSFTYNQRDLNMIVTNKVVNRKGILIETVASDGLSTVSTKNLMFDALTGRTLLTSVQNNFEKPIFNYSMPAHWYYSGMDAAYKNFGFEVASKPFVNRFNYEIILGGFTLDEQNKCEIGDEILLTTNDPSLGSKKAYIAAKTISGADNRIHVKPFTTNGFDGYFKDNYSFKIIRSGHKNLINADAGSIVALKDPTSGRYTTNCSYNNSPPPPPPPPGGGSACNPVSWSTALSTSGYCLSGGYLNAIKNMLLGARNSDHTITADATIHALPTPVSACGALPAIMGYSIQTDPNNTDTNCPPNIRLYNCDLSGTCFAELSPLSCTMFASPNASFFPPSVTTSNYKITNIAIDPAYSNTSTTILFKVFCTLGTYSTSFRYKLTQPFKSCGATVSVSGSMPYCNTNMVINKIDKVLSANAVVYSDAWIYNRNNLTSQQSDALNQIVDINNMQVSNYYASGIRGIWRPSENYTYVDDRKQTVDGSSIPNVKISEDGTFDALPIYQWENPFFNKACEDTKKWRLTNTITAYNSQNSEEENKNILDIFSAALFGYKQSLNTAVAASARQIEIGYTGFEEYKRTMASGSEDFYFGKQQDNIRFYNKDNGVNTSIIYDAYDVIVGSDNSITLNIPSGAVNFAINEEIIGNFVKGEPYENIVKSFKVTAVSSYLGFTQLTLDQDVTTTGFNKGKKVNGETQTTTCFTGKIFKKSSKTIDFSNYLNVKIAPIAHTGKYSLRFRDSYTSATAFKQNNIRLEKGKEYVISAWVRVEDGEGAPGTISTPLPNYNSTGVSVGVQFGSTAPVYFTATTDGHIIEGWQKIEGKFVVPTSISESDKYPVLLLKGGNITNSSIEDPTFYTYFDDIRIYPFEGNMQAFVYDADNFKLKATLDQNNFATFYYYDEQGNLFLLKRETEKGKVTIQETRSHIKVN